MISLLRSHNLGAYGFGGGYEPGMSSESGFQIGRERTLRYALVPHAGDWREAGVFRDGMEFNHPLLVRKVLPHGGSLPARWGLLEVSSPNVVVSALKPGRDGTAVLRVYEATGRPAPDLKIAFNARVARGALGQSPGRPRGRAEGREQRRLARPAALPDPDDPAAAGRSLNGPTRSRRSGRTPWRGVRPDPSSTLSCWRDRDVRRRRPARACGAACRPSWRRCTRTRP